MSRADPYTVRTLDSSDVEPVLDLISSTLGSGSVPRTRAFWNWKHSENPFGPSPALVAECNGEIIGLRAFLPWQWRSRGLSLRAVRAVDTATHPGWQGRGIFRRLTQELARQMQEAGVAFVFNTPNNQSRQGYLSMGWSGLGRLPVLARISRSAVLAWSGTVSRQQRPLPRLEPLPEVGELLTADGLVSFLRRVEQDDERLHTVRDLDYLRWRYGQVPEIRYRALWDWDDLGGAIIIVRGRLRRRLREVTVCEVLAPADTRSSDAARALLDRLVHIAEADYLLAWGAPRTAERRALLRAGFLPLPRVGPHLTVRQLNKIPGTVDPAARRSWRLSIGDLELF